MAARVNLLPTLTVVTKQRARRARFWRTIGMTYAVALVLTCGVLKVVTAPGRASAISELVMLQQREQASLDQLKVFQTQLRQVSQKLDGRRTLAGQPDWSALLSLLGTCIEPGTSVRQLSLRSSGTDPNRQFSTAPGTPPPLTTNEPRHFTLTIQGATRRSGGSVRFANRLRSLELFDSVDLNKQFRDPNGDDRSEAFDIVCVLSDSHGGRR